MPCITFFKARQIRGERETENTVRKQIRLSIRVYPSRPILIELFEVKVKIIIFSYNDFQLLLVILYHVLAFISCFAGRSVDSTAAVTASKQGVYLAAETPGT